MLSAMFLHEACCLHANSLHAQALDVRHISVVCNLDVNATIQKYVCYCQLACVMQRSMIDVIAISMGFVATFKPAAAELTIEQPPQQLSGHQNRALVVVAVVVVGVMFWAATFFLQHQAWFSESTGDTADVTHLSLPCHEPA